MSYLRSFFAVVLAAGPLALVACPASSPHAVAPVPSTTATASDAASTIAPSASAEPSASTGDATSSSGSPLKNTGVKSPVFSTDPCNVDADCAPVATCHSEKCVAAKSAGVMAPGTLCTMDCRGGTIDCGFNHCGCAAAPAGGKRCALLAGPKP